MSLYAITLYSVPATYGSYSGQNNQAPNIENVKSQTGIGNIYKTYLFKTHDYSKENSIVKWKKILKDYLDGSGAPQNIKAIVMAMAMQESKDFHQWDWKKDSKTDGTANFGLLNLNEDFISQIDSSYDQKDTKTGAYSKTWKIKALNYLGDNDWTNSIKSSADLAIKGLQKGDGSYYSYNWGNKNYSWQPINSMLNFHRAGESGMTHTGQYDCPKSKWDSSSGDCIGYREHIASIAYMLMNNQDLWNGGIRIESDCEYK